MKLENVFNYILNFNLISIFVLFSLCFLKFLGLFFPLSDGLKALKVTRIFFQFDEKSIERYSFAFEICNSIMMTSFAFLFKGVSVSTEFEMRGSRVTEGSC